MVKKKVEEDAIEAEVIPEETAQEQASEPAYEETALFDPNMWVRICRPSGDTQVEYCIRLAYIHAIEGPLRGEPAKAIIRDFAEDGAVARQLQLTQDITYECYLELRKLLLGARCPDEVPAP